jgi:two-component system probable response regulator PhcQ
MQPNFYDYKRFAILYVDDEEKALKLFDRTFSDRFRILTAPNAAEGFRILQEKKDEIGLLMTDQRMPGEKGVQLLERARQFRPRIIRILATAFTDIDAAVDAVNSGAIYKYVHKPFDVPLLDLTLKRSLEFFIVQRERDQLLREKLSVLHNMMITDRVVSLGIMAAGLGHHIRNSLVAVRTFLDLAPAKLGEENVNLEDLRDPNFWNDFYKHVQAQIERITSMLSDLGIAVSNTEPVFEDKIDAKSVIAEAAAACAPDLQRKNLTLVQDLPDDLPQLVVNKNQFRKLFELLFRDEITTLSEGNEIRITGRISQSASLVPEVQISITDSGNGLPQEALRSVFDPFFVRADQPQEFGINLMGCYFIVFHHGGRIEARNRPEGGAEFILKFPVIPPARFSGEDEHKFLAQVLSNETLWDRLLAGG